MYNQGKNNAHTNSHYASSSNTHHSLPARPEAMSPPASFSPNPNWNARTTIPVLISNPYAPNQFEHALRPHTTPEGYTISSAYVPNSAANSAANAPTLYFGGNNSLPSFSRQNGGYHNSGAHTCKRQGCGYRGSSAKDTELHMMDRHFIYPPGYHQNGQKRKRDDGGGPDGDAGSYVLLYCLHVLFLIGNIVNFLCVDLCSSSS